MASIFLRFVLRTRVRMLLTVMSVTVVMVAFLAMRTIVETWNAEVLDSADQRYIVRNRISMTFPLPLAYVSKLGALPGVQGVSWSNYFGGTYKHIRNRFGKVAVDAPSYYKLHPEYRLPPKQMEAWLQDQAGAVAGDLLAKKYGWQVGDRIVVKGTIYPGDWVFNLRGIYTAAEEKDRREFQFHWRYLNETIERGRRDQVGSIVIRASSPETAHAIDQHFVSSVAETHTESEAEFERSFMSGITAIISVINVMSVAVLVLLMLVVGSTMAMSARERLREYAAMRAIGFRSRHILALVLCEAAFIAALGTLLGLAFTTPVLRSFSAYLEQELGTVWRFELSYTTVVVAAVMAIAGAALAAGIPAVRASRRPIAVVLGRI